MVRVLTLFSGTHSVGKVCSEYGWEETSLDLYQPADIEEDVLQWDWRTYPRGYFDIIWASPDCSQYSRAKTTGGRRKLGHADKMVKKTLTIINDLQPRIWFIENPETGMLKTRDFMLLRPRIVVDYCKYGLPYRKRTAVWSNVCEHLAPIVQLCYQDCEYCVGGRHITTIQDMCSGKLRGQIPTSLLRDIFDECSALMSANKI